MILGGGLLGLGGGGGGRPYMGPQEIKYLFIDGSYLRFVLKDFFMKLYDTERIKYLDFEKIKRIKPAGSNISASQGFTKIFYYDCPVPRKNGESKEDHDARRQEQKDFFNSMRSMDGYHVFEGTTTGRPGKERQKQVDVKIAVDTLMHAHRGNMHHCTLLAGDLDFKPLVDALVLEGMYITLWYEKRSTSKKLIYAADSTMELNFRKIFELLPNVIQRDLIFPQFNITSAYPKELTPSTKIQEVENKNGEPIYLHNFNGTYHIVGPKPEPNPNNHFKTYKCHDLNMLKKYYKLVNEDQSIDWDI